MSSDNQEEFRIGMELRNFQVSFSGAVGYQIADEPSNPGAFFTLTDFATSEGFVFPSTWQDRKVTTSSKPLVRFGYMAKTTSGTDTTHGYMSAWVTSRKKS